MALRKIVDKRVRFEMHASNLETYITSGSTPRGLRVYLEPAMGTFSRHERQQWSSILNDASLGLTRVVMQHCTRRATELKEEERARLNQSSLNRVGTAELAKYEEGKRFTIQGKKEKKCQRDGVLRAITPILLLTSSSIKLKLRVNHLRTSPKSLMLLIYPKNR